MALIAEFFKKVNKETRFLKNLKYFFHFSLENVVEIVQNSLSCFIE